MVHIVEKGLEYISMISVGVFIFWLFGIVVIFWSGICLVKICKLKESIELYYMAGIILLISASHILASVAEPLDLSFTLYKYMFLVLFGVIIVAMSLYLWKKKEADSI